MYLQRLIRMVLDPLHHVLIPNRPNGLKLQYQISMNMLVSIRRERAIKSISYLLIEKVSIKEADKCERPEILDFLDCWSDLVIQVIDCFFRLKSQITNFLIARS